EGTALPRCDFERSGSCGRRDWSRPPRVAGAWGWIPPGGSHAARPRRRSPADRTRRPTNGPAPPGSRKNCHSMSDHLLSLVIPIEADAEVVVGLPVHVQGANKGATPMAAVSFRAMICLVIRSDDPHGTNGTDERPFEHERRGTRGSGPGPRNASRPPT